MANAAPAADPLQRLAWVFPSLFVVLWSTGFIGAKFGLPYAEPATFLVIRFLGVLAVLLPLCWLVRAPWPATRAEFVHMAIAGALIQGGYLGGVFLSLSKGMPAGVSSLITALQPILAAVLSGWLLGERTNRRQWLGLALGIAGVALVVREKWMLEGVGFLATALSVLALLSISFGAIWQKRHCARVDLRTGAAIQFAAALLVLAPYSLLFETREVTWSPELLLAMVWLVFALSLGAVFLLFWLIRHGAATKVASLMYLVPPCTALIAWPLFGETYTAFSAAGMALAMLGVWLVSKG
ncbi:MAG TPA: DMT family transporter [Burkholderiales bacterium]|jgi:drug/metabolite transporter (DMT)-like permease|nr:DMT family transporter [Burkholderiales bacterium]